MSVAPTVIAAGWSWGWRGRPGTALPRHRRVEIDILSFIGSKPCFQRVTSRPDHTVRKTTRCRPPRRRPDRVLCRFCSIKANFQPAFSLRERRSPPPPFSHRGRACGSERKRLNHSPPRPSNKSSSSVECLLSGVQERPPSLPSCNCQVSPVHLFTTNVRRAATGCISMSKHPGGLDVFSGPAQPRSPTNPTTVIRQMSARVITNVRRFIETPPVVKSFAAKAGVSQPPAYTQYPPNACRAIGGPFLAKNEAVGCPVLHLLRVRRPGGPGKSPGLPASRAQLKASGSIAPKSSRRLDVLQGKVGDVVELLE